MRAVTSTASLRLQLKSRPEHSQRLLPEAGKRLLPVAEAWEGLSKEGLLVP